MEQTVEIRTKIVWKIIKRLKIINGVSKINGNRFKDRTPLSQIHSSATAKYNLSPVNETVNRLCLPRKPSLTVLFHISKPIHHDKIELNDERIKLAGLCLAERRNYVRLIDKSLGKRATL